MKRRAFTLVELLVSTGLVMLMLAMFATIFSIATSSLGTQRGIAENDQRARTLTTMLHNDINARTFKIVIPHAPNEVSGSDRRGYFYISENDLNDDRDDVLAFTIEVPGDTPLFGRASHLFWDDVNGDGLSYQDANGNGTYDHGEPLENIYGNQPEMDGDGDFENATGALQAAEVVYFLRGGNLYRRVMLIRRGDNDAAQPQMDDGTELFDPTLPQTTGGTPYDHAFYQEFDYSVYAADFGNGHRLKFHGEDSLENDTISGGQFSLGRPQSRFGHDYLTGQPREYTEGPNGPNTQYLGRFIHEETSHNTFLYPHDLSRGNPVTNDPSDPDYLPLPDANQDGVVDDYERGPRRAEDILMTHVHGFDVKVWDDHVGRFENIGWQDAPNSTPPVVGDYSESASLHRTNTPPIVYGPRTAARNRVFDTWHPAVDIDGDGTNDPPPYRPTRWNRGGDLYPGVRRVDDDGNGVIDDDSELGTPGSDDFLYPQPMRAIQITVRYHDVSSDQTRQLTLEFSLTD